MAVEIASICLDMRFLLIVVVGFDVARSMAGAASPTVYGAHIDFGTPLHGHCNGTGMRMGMGMGMGNNNNNNTVRSFSFFKKSMLSASMKMVENMTPEQLQEQANMLRSESPPMQLRAIPPEARAQLAAQFEMFAQNPAMWEQFKDQMQNLDPNMLTQAYDQFMSGRWGETELLFVFSIGWVV